MDFRYAGSIFQHLMGFEQGAERVFNQVSIPLVDSDVVLIVVSCWISNVVTKRRFST